jgi:hypothetical protein
MYTQFYVAKGILRYQGDWITVDAPHDVVNYYKWWVEKFLGKKISTSYHNPHITVLAGKHEQGLSKHPLWKKYDGKELDFLYQSEIYTDHDWFFRGQYFWLRVECPFLAQVRTELGLKPNLKWPLHLTIGFCGY